MTDSTSVNWSKKELQLLHSLAIQASAATSFEQYFQFFCNSIGPITSFDGACVFVSEDNWETISRSYYWFCSARQSERTDINRITKQVPVANSYIEIVARTRQASIHDTLKDQPYHDLKYFHDNMGFSSCVQLPLMIDSHVTAILSLWGTNPGQFSDADLRMVEESINLLSLSLQCNLLHKRIEVVQNKLKESLRVDWLTGLSTRIYFLQRAETELSRAKRHKQSFCLLFLDLDNFREVNTTFGHLGGDEALRQFGKLVKRVSRSFDVLGRYGGEEFLILLPQTDLQGGLAAASRLCEMLEHEPIEVVPAKKIKLGASIGISVYPENGKTIEDLIQQADIAMYQAKARGGDHAIHIG
ncbi:diguanylate cyclase [Chloroflexota bacterium]